MSVNRCLTAAAWRTDYARAILESLLARGREIDSIYQAAAAVLLKNSLRIRQVRSLRRAFPNEVRVDRRVLTVQYDYPKSVFMKWFILQHATRLKLANPINK
jgi:hypothetical protein